MATKTIYISASWNSYDKEFNYSIRGYEPTAPDILVEAREISFETPTEKELKARTVEALREKKQQVLAEAQAEALEIEQKIGELLALEDHSS